MAPKKCSDCKQTKPTTEFNVNRARPDGLHYYCKACVKIRSASKSTSQSALNARKERNARSYQSARIERVRRLGSKCATCPETDPSRIFPVYMTNRWAPKNERVLATYLLCDGCRPHPGGPRT